MLEEESISYIKSNKKKLLKDFASTKNFPKENIPISFFMAGSAGAGKTEFSKAFIEIFEEEFDRKIVRIDADEIKNWLPQYTGKNSNEVEKASYVGVEKLYDHCLSKKQNLILDGTFSNLDKSIENIERSIKKMRYIEIYYLFQDPVVSWNFTKKRGEIEGRTIPKDFFIDSFILSQENVEKVKERFKDFVILHIVIKNFNNGVEKFKLNVNNVKSYIKRNYTRKELEYIIKE